MKQILTIFLILVINNFKSFAGNSLYITLNPFDCVTCSAGLYTLSRESYINEVPVVLPSDLAEDNKTIIEKLGTTNFPKIHYIYSDSLFNALHGNIDKSELIVLNSNNEIIYRNPLRILDLAKVSSLLNDGLSQIDTSCIMSIPNSTARIGINNKSDLVFYDTKFSQNGILSTVKKSKFSINVDEEKLYRTLYKDSFQIMYPAMQKMIIETPAFKHHLTKTSSWGDNIGLVYTVRSYTVKPETGDTGIYMNLIPVKYHMNNGALSYYKIENLSKRGFDSYELYFDGSRCYMYGKQYPEKNMMLTELRVNEEKHELELKQLFAHSITYSQRKLAIPDNVYIMPRIKKNILCYDWTDSLYRITNNGIVPLFKIPLPERKLSTYNEFYILDFTEDEHAFYFIFGVSPSYSRFYMKCSKTGERLELSKIGDLSSVGVICFDNSGSIVLYKPTNQNCLRRATIRQLIEASK